MFRHGFIWRLLLSLLLVAVLAVGGVALYRAGFAQGYQAAALTAGTSGQATAPAVPYYGVAPWGYGPGWGFPFFFPFAPLLGFGFLLLVFLLIGGIFRGGRRFAGPYGHGPGHWGYGGPDPRWGRAWGYEGQEQPKPQPEKGAGPGNAAPQG